MKKDRNSFFSQFGSYGYNNTQMPMMPAGQQQAMPMQMGSGYALQNDNQDLDARISKLEREINRLDARISKLESSTVINQNSNNTDYNFANSMYMV